MGAIVQNIDYTKYDYFIFDLYGTLIDIHTDEYRSSTWKNWMKWLDENNIKHPWYPIFRYQFFKMDKKYRCDALNNANISHPEIDVIDIYTELFDTYGNSPDADMVKKASYAFRCASTDYIRLFPGVPDYLTFLRDNGKKIYILSNAQASYTEPEIIHFDLPRFVDKYYISSKFGCMKPDINFYNAIIRNENIDVNRAIMIGDSHESDIIGGINAGMDAFLIHKGDLFTSLQACF